MNTTQLPRISVDLAQAATKSDSWLSKEPIEAIQRAEHRYKKFLFLVLKYPDLPLAPSRDVDEMWHLHMLHPRSYFADCSLLFGDILDHDGGFGSEQHELPELINLFNQTASLWEQEFGEPYVDPHDVGTSMNNCIKACRVASEGLPENKLMVVITKGECQMLPMMNMRQEDNSDSDVIDSKDSLFWVYSDHRLRS